MQISCLRAEQTQLSRSLEKERQRAAENRQEYLAAKEEADTHEGRVSQLEEEVRELRRKHNQELQEALTHQELLQQVAFVILFSFFFSLQIVYQYEWCFINRPEQAKYLNTNSLNCILNIINLGT